MCFVTLLFSVFGTIHIIDLCLVFTAVTNALRIVLIVLITISAKRDHAQNMTNSAISLVANNVIPLPIGQPALALITLIMHHVCEGTQPYPFPVTWDGHGRVTEPQGNHLSGRNLSVIPKCDKRLR